MKPRLRLRLHCAAAISAAFDNEKKRKKKSSLFVLCWLLHSFI